MAVMVNNHGNDTLSWQVALQAALPDMPVYAYPDLPNVEDIHYAAVWHHPHDDLLTYKNLKAVLILGAGTDHIDQAPKLPDVPIVRLIDPAVGTDMAQYILYWLMHFQRGYETYRQQQLSKVWQRYEYPLASTYRTTILGAGQIATFIAERVALNGFKVNVWSRSPRSSSDTEITYYHGDDGLDLVLKSTDTLVNCLPLKPQTKHLINRRLLSKLPKGAHFINVSRGAVVDDQALLDALDADHLAGASLDAFSAEPLAADHRFWSHAKVYVTPHMSGATFTRTAAQVVADNILRMENGEAPFPIYAPQNR